MFTDLPEAELLVDADRIAVHGISRGGGLARSAGPLADGVAAIVARVPFLLADRMPPTTTRLGRNEETS